MNDRKVQVSSEMFAPKVPRSHSSYLTTTEKHMGFFSTYEIGFYS